MNACQNCGKLNAVESHFCRFCGTRISSRQTMPEVPVDRGAPRPYAWKTDELSTGASSRRTHPTGYVAPAQDTRGFDPGRQYQAGPLAHHGSNYFAAPFRCPMCSSQMPPRISKRISTAGWVTFAVLLVVFFPLFWIGLLIKEDVAECQSCGSKIALGPQR